MENRISFKASISSQMVGKLYRQLPQKTDRKKTATALKKQLENIKNWGTNDSEIVVTKNPRGTFCLGLKYNVTPAISFTWAIKGLSGRTELSQFLALKKEHILNTEATIKYLHAKYGSGIFKLTK